MPRVSHADIGGMDQFAPHPAPPLADNVLYRIGQLEAESAGLRKHLRRARVAAWTWASLFVGFFLLGYVASMAGA